MTFRGAPELPWWKPIAVVVVTAGLVAVAMFWWNRWSEPHAQAARRVQNSATDICLVPGRPDTIRLSSELKRKFGFVIAEVKPAPPPEPVRFPGSLFLDPTRLVAVHSRFAGEVMSIGAIAGGQSTDPAEVGRDLRYGDPVLKGQLLAVIWSRDIGEKKSEMIDAISRLDLDQAELKRVQALPGVVTQRQLNEAQRNVQASLIAVDKAERTLRSWRLSDEEIDAVRREAQEVMHGEKSRDTDRTWAEVDVRASMDGVLVERNVNVGSMVDSSDDLFKLADLSRIRVLAYVYEEYLPALRRLTPEQRRWSITLVSDPGTPPIEGEFELIGNIIDPAQHTAAVMGWLPNPDGKLSVGQFVTATILLPPEPGIIAVPPSALVDDGYSSSVFVETDAQQSEFSRRRLAVVRRGRGLVFIRAVPTDLERQAGAKPLDANAHVLVGGILQLAAAMDALQAKSGEP